MGAMGRWVAQVTVAANAWGPSRIRDSESAPRRRGPGAPRLRRPRPPAEVLSPALGGHDIAFVGAECVRQWVCRVCHRSAERRMPFAARPCQGSAAARWAQQAVVAASTGAAYGKGHVLLLSDAITWCFCCGAYACAQARLLQKPCPGHVRTSQWRRNARQRLLMGLHPDKRTPLAGDAVPEPGTQLPTGFAVAVRAALRSSTTVASAPPPPARNGSSGQRRRETPRRSHGQTSAPEPAPPSEPAWRTAMLTRIAAKRVAQEGAEGAPSATRRRLWFKQPEP